VQHVSGAVRGAARDWSSEGSSTSLVESSEWRAVRGAARHWWSRVSGEALSVHTSHYLHNN